MMLRMRLLYDIALDQLALGQCALVFAREAESEDFAEATEYLDAAVDGLRKSGRQDELPRGLLAHAGLYRIQQDFVHARQDLDDAWEIATRSGMRLFECDIHLESARVFMAMNEAGEALDASVLPPDSPFVLYLDTTGADEPESVTDSPNLKAARAHLAEAGRLIEDTGYHRRDPELLLENARLEFLDGHSDIARATLAKAKANVDEMGCHGLDYEVRLLTEAMDMPGASPLQG